MLFSKSTVVALLGVINVAAQGPAIPDWIGPKSPGKAVHTTGESTSTNRGFTLVETVATPTRIQPTTMSGDTDPVMPDYTPEPPFANSSLIPTATNTGSRASRSSQGFSMTVPANGSATVSTVVSIVTSNVTIIKHTGTATLGNGTNRTTSATLTPMPTSTSPGSTIAPYGAGLLVVLVGFVAMGL